MMDDAGLSYDPRYLAGIVLFNRGDYFEAHEVWEALWMETFGEEKRFYQALIQAAVGLCHFCNGNLRGRNLRGQCGTTRRVFGDKSDRFHIDLSFLRRIDREKFRV